MSESLKRVDSEVEQYPEWGSNGTRQVLILLRRNTGEDWVGVWETIYWGNFRPTIFIVGRICFRNPHKLKWHETQCIAFSSEITMLRGFGAFQKTTVMIMLREFWAIVELFELIYFHENLCYQSPLTIKRNNEARRKINPFSGKFIVLPKFICPKRSSLWKGNFSADDCPTCIFRLVVFGDFSWNLKQ